MAIQLQVLRFTCLLLLQSCCPITVSCTPCREGSVQLYNGTSPEEGIIEYCSNGFWRAVCDVNWNYQNSFVACRQLGLPATAAVPHLRMYHPFPLGFYFNCLGNESSLADCRATRTLSCNIDNTAGVQCAGEMIAGCTDGGIRLIGGRLTESEGRVEICSNGVWGTVYDGGSWDNRDATVICRQLGYSMAISYSGGLLGNGTGPILYAYLNCTGNETALSECGTTQSIPFGTQHFSDAGVRCLNASHSNCSDGAVRLANGTTFLEGRVEVCYNGIWGSVCDNAWDNVDAAVVCRQLGFPRDSVIAVNGSYFGDGEGPYLLSDTVCTKYRNRLLHCSRQRGVHEYTSECSPGHSAGVICEEICSHGDIRLKYRNLPQVCVNGIWSHICKEAINTSAISRTLCKQLLSVEELESVHVETCSYSARYSRLPSVLYDVSCSEQSRYVTQDCTFNVSQSIEITPSRRCYSVLSLACIPLANCKEGAVRLVDRRSPLEGRVEVCVSGFWGVLATAQIHSYYSFPKMPKDICKQLGLPWEWALPSGGFSGSYPLLSSCTSGDEHCYRPSCGRSSGYGVICQGNTSKPRECKNFDVRLVNGSDKTEGRLELCANGYWSNVCIDYYYEYSIYSLVASIWNDHAANLVCRKLGFPTEVLNNYDGSPYGSNPSLPLVTVDCGVWDAWYTPVVNDIAADCRILNRCSHKRSIVSVSCGGITFYLGTEAATRDGGTTLTCQDSIRPSSTLSLIKNGQIVATSSHGMLEINTKTVNANPFGVYTCQQNVSGKIFEKTAFLKEQVSVRVMIEKENQSLCDYTTESIEEALFSKISTECRCDFSQGDFNDSSIDCEESGELTYKSTIEYSDSEGFETASVIIYRLVSQIPFSLMVEGMPVRVTAVVLDCADCKSSPQSTILSPAGGSCLFVGGFATGALVVLIIVIILMIIIIGARKYRHSRQSRADDESKLDNNDKTGTLTSQPVPVCPIGNDKENVIELKEK